MKYFIIFLLSLIIISCDNITPSSKNETLMYLSQQSQLPQQPQCQYINWWMCYDTVINTCCNGNTVQGCYDEQWHSIPCPAGTVCSSGSMLESIILKSCQ